MNGVGVDSIPTEVIAAAKIQHDGTRSNNLGDQPVLGFDEAPKLPDGEWYGKLVKYHLDRRAFHDRFWQEVDQHAWDKRTEWSSVSGSFGGARPIGLVKTGRIKAFLDSISASVFTRNPKVNVRGFTARMTDGIAPLWETALNNEWSEKNELRRQSRLCINDCAKYGYGIMMTSFDGRAAVSATRQRQNRKQQLAGDLSTQLGDIHSIEAAQQNVAFGGGQRNKRVNYEMDEAMLRGRVTSRRISPYKFLVDPDAWSLESARWMGREIVVHLDALKADPNVDQMLVKGLQPHNFTSAEYQRHFAGRNDKSDPYQKVVLYEIFERQPDGAWRMVLFPRGSRNLLREKKDIYWIGQPYSMLRWNEDGEEIFAQPDMLNAWRLYMSETLMLTKVLQTDSRRMADLLFVDESAGISEEVIQSAIQGKTSGVIKVKKMGGKPMRDAFFQPVSATGNSESIGLLQLMEKGFQIASGLGANQQSQALKSETSATEAEEIALQSRARGAHRQAAAEEFIADITYRRMGLMAQYYGKEDMLRLAGPDLAEKWTEDWTPEDIKDGMEVLVHPGSMRPHNDAVALQQKQALIQTFGSHPILASILNYPEIGKDMAEDMGIQRGSKYFTNTDGPDVSDAMAQAGIAQTLGGAQQGSAPSAGRSPASGAQGAQQS